MSKEKKVSDLSTSEKNDESEVYMKMDAVIMMQKYASNKESVKKIENGSEETVLLNNVEASLEKNNSKNYLVSVLGTHIVSFAQKVIESRKCMISGLTASFNEFTLNSEKYKDYKDDDAVDKILQDYIECERKLGKIKDTDYITVEKIKADYEEHLKNKNNKSEYTQNIINVSEIDAIIPEGIISRINKETQDTKDYIKDEENLINGSEIDDPEETNEKE